MLCLNDLGHDKKTIYFYNKYIIDDLKKKTLQFRIFIIGLMDHLANLRTSSTNLLFHEQDLQAKADLEFLRNGPKKR